MGTRSWCGVRAGGAISWWGSIEDEGGEEILRELVPVAEHVLRDSLPRRSGEGRGENQKIMRGRGVKPLILPSLKL